MHDVGIYIVTDTEHRDNQMAQHLHLRCTAACICRSASCMGAANTSRFCCLCLASCVCKHMMCTANDHTMCTMTTQGAQQCPYAVYSSDHTQMLLSVPWTCIARCLTYKLHDRNCCTTKLERETSPTDRWMLHTNYERLECLQICFHAAASVTARRELTHASTLQHLLFAAKLKSAL